MKRALVLTLFALGLGALGGGSASANGTSIVTQYGAILMWNAHNAYIVYPGQPVGPVVPNCAVGVGQNIEGGGITTTIYNGSVINEFFLLTQVGAGNHRWYYNDVVGCKDQGAF